MPIVEPLAPIEISLYVLVKPFRLDTPLIRARIPQFDRQSSIRFSSRRARTLESLASLYEVMSWPLTFLENMS